MKKRFKMSRRASKRNFSRHAIGSHSLNRANPMRGGIRL